MILLTDILFINSFLGIYSVIKMPNSLFLAIMSIFFIICHKTYINALNQKLSIFESKETYIFLGRKTGTYNSNRNKISLFKNFRVVANKSRENYIMAKDKMEFWERKKYEKTDHSWSSIYFYYKR